MSIGVSVNIFLGLGFLEWIDGINGTGLCGSHIMMKFYDLVLKNGRCYYDKTNSFIADYDFTVDSCLCDYSSLLVRREGKAQK